MIPDAPGQCTHHESSNGLASTVVTNPQHHHTPGHHDCPVCERALAVQSSELSPQMTFAEAFEIWMGARVIDSGEIFTNARFISKRAERDLRQYARAAREFFGNLRLEEVHAGHFREYQRARALCDRSVGAWQKRAGANLIRKEVQTVARVLRAAGAWTKHLEESFEPVQPVASDIPRAMSPEEQHGWLHTAASREEWRVVYWWSLVALQTTMSTNEIRALRLGDIFLHQGTLQVRSEGAKNKFRIRTIPLQTAELVWALGSLIERARKLGASGPHCYLFPFHITGDRYDALRPMTVWGLRKPWQAVRDATGLGWLRAYDLRHTAITRMAEAGVPIQVIMAFAGHISPEMQRHYTAISMEAKRRWAAAAWSGTVPGAGMSPGLPEMPTGKGRWVWQPEAKQLAV